MLALSVKQPWAYAIAHLGKDIENRFRFPPKHATGQIIAVVATKAPDPIYETEVEIYLNSLGYKIPSALPRSQIVALTTLQGAFFPYQLPDRSVGLVTPSHKSSPWIDGPICWCLSDTIAINYPEIIRGQPGLYQLPKATEIIMQSMYQERNQ